MNRQVYEEASDIFYMENLFIRVNMVGQRMGEPRRAGAERSWNIVPILSEGSNAQACTRHAMEIDLIPGFHTDGDNRHNHFIFASQDLPMFCRAFQSQDPDPPLRMKLYIFIGDEIGIAREKSENLSMSTDGKSMGSKTAAMKYAAAICEDPIENPDERDGASYEDSMDGGSTTANVIGEAKSTLSEPPLLTDNSRLQRLLEPFLAVDSIGYSYIDAPISESCRLKIRNSMSRARPSTLHYLSVIDSAFDEAIAIFDSRNFALAISKMRGTLDTMLDFCYQSTYMKATEKVTTGRFSGMECEVALNEMIYILWNKLARANLEFPKESQHVHAAKFFAWWCVDWHKRPDLVLQPGRRADKRAMAHYLEVEVWEALDRLGEHEDRNRSDALRDVVDMLNEALEHWPGNMMLEKELQRRLKEMVEADRRQWKGREAYWLNSKQGS